MNKTIVAYTGVLAVAVLLTWISVAYAETYDVEISSTGFSPNNGTMNINHGDNITFTIVNGTTGHELSNPWLGGSNFLNYDNPSITHSFTECSSYTFTLDYHVDQLNVGVENCPPPVVVEVVPTNSTSTTPYDYGEVETIDVTTATPYTENGDPIINGEPQVEDETPTKRDYESASNETLGLRLQILTVLESILSIIFGK